MNPQLLHTSANLGRRVHLFPFVSTLNRYPTTSRVNLDGPPRYHRQLAITASLTSHSVLRKPLRHVGNQFGRLDENETIVDGISFKNVAKGTANDQGYPGMFDSGSCLFSR